MTLFVVGLGPGDAGQITRQAWEILGSAEDVYLRTAVHPSVAALPPGPTYHNFDDLYEQAEDFAEVYDTIASRIAKMAVEQPQVVYAVPGDPMVAEGTVTRLLALCKASGVPIEIVHGVSFIEPSLAAVGLDGSDGLQIVDAGDLAAAHHPHINPDRPALIAQLYSQRVASDVKLTLMNAYPDGHPVVMIHAAGTAEQRVQHLPLHEIDHVSLAHLTTLYVPQVDTTSGAVTSFEGFQETIAHLRAPDGCPWDREQTHESLRPYLLEETYEVLEAIDSGDSEALREELGDLLVQVVLHTQIAVDDGEFQMPDVIRGVDAKLKRRHPHVWGDVNVHGDVERVKANWQTIKAQERADKGQAEPSLLDGVPKNLPALAQAHAYDDRAARAGFDWKDEHGVIEKVREELDEVLGADTADKRLHELGDLLLAVAVWGRWLEINPEDALRAANRRFAARLGFVERAARAQGKTIEQMTFEELDALWIEAKRQETGNG